MVSNQVLLCSIGFKFVAMFIGVCGNMAVIILTRMSKFWSKEMTNTSYFVGNLALADLLMCLTLYPTWIVELVLTILDIKSHQVLFCKFSRSFAFSLLFASVASLLAITVDRYIYIVKPLKYPLIVTPRRVFVLISAIWLITCCIFSLLYFDTETHKAGFRSLCFLTTFSKYYLEILVFIPVILIIVLNLWLLFVSRKQRKKILTAVITVPNSNSNEDRMNKKTRRMIVLRFFAALKEAKTFSIVVAVLMLCVITPSLVGAILYNFCSNEVWSYWYLNFHYEFYGINSVVNAFIYGIRHVKYRKAFAKMFFKVISCLKVSN